MTIISTGNIAISRNVECIKHSLKQTYNAILYRVNNVYHCAQGLQVHIVGSVLSGEQC